MSVIDSLVKTSPTCYFSLSVEAPGGKPILKCLAVIFPYTFGNTKAAENIPDILSYSVIAVYTHNKRSLGKGSRLPIIFDGMDLALFNVGIKFSGKLLQIGSVPAEDQPLTEMLQILYEDFSSSFGLLRL